MKSKSRKSLPESGLGNEYTWNEIAAMRTKSTEMERLITQYEDWGKIALVAAGHDEGTFLECPFAGPKVEAMGNSPNEFPCKKIYPGSFYRQRTDELYPDKCVLAGEVAERIIKQIVPEYDTRAPTAYNCSRAAMQIYRIVTGVLGIPAIPEPGDITNIFHAWSEEVYYKRNLEARLLQLEEKVLGLDDRLHRKEYPSGGIRMVPGRSLYDWEKKEIIRNSYMRRADYEESLVHRGYNEHGERKRWRGGGED